MILRHRALILLLAILWQSLSMLSPMAMAQKVQDVEHAALHLQAHDHHHHHHDRSLHFEPADSTTHLHADGGFGSNGLPPGEPSQALAVRAVGPGVAPVAGMPSPFLDGPLRPPRHTA